MSFVQLICFHVLHVCAINGFDDVAFLHVGATSNVTQTTPREMPAWTGIMPLSFCNSPNCIKALDFNFQEQRISAYPVEESLCEPGTVLHPRRDILINSDDMKYSVVVPEGVRLRRHFYKDAKGRIRFYEYTEPSNRPAKFIWIFFHPTESFSDHYLNVMFKFTTKHDAIVLVFDEFGYGRSHGLYFSKGILIDDAKDTNSFLDDVLPALVESRDPPLKVFARGDSLGSLHLLASAAVKASKFAYAGVILGETGSSTDTEFLVVPFWLAKVLTAIGYLVHPLWPMSPTENLAELSIRNYEELHEAFKHLTAFELHPARVVSTYMDLNHNLQLIDQLLGEVENPCLFIVAGSDRVLPPEGAHAMYEKIASKDKDIFVIEGAEHVEAAFFLPEGDSGVLNNGVQLNADQLAIAKQNEEKTLKWIYDRL